MKALVFAATAALAVATAIEPADAWMRGGGGFGGGWGRTAGGGVYHSGDAGGFEHGTAVGPNGVAHEGDAGGYWHGCAGNGYGAAHASTYGGYYHGTYDKRLWRVAYRRLRRLLSSAGGGELLWRELLELRLWRLGLCRRGGRGRCGRGGGRSRGDNRGGDLDGGATYGYLPSGCAIHPSTARPIRAAAIGCARPIVTSAPVLRVALGRRTYGIRRKGSGPALTHSSNERHEHAARAGGGDGRRKADPDLCRRERVYRRAGADLRSAANTYQEDANAFTSWYSG